MKIGIPKEVKIKENRVSCTPGCAGELVKAGHELVVQSGAGDGSGFNDRQYAEVGATIVPVAEDTWAADMVVHQKVGEAVDLPYSENPFAK